ncbi:MAG: KEOPS complex subunit Pcc1 [Salinirussus sp.]
MKRVCLRTDHGDAELARVLAAAVAPDNTGEMTTRADGTTVVTRIERPETGSLQATVDDYVLNLRTAATVANGEPTRDAEPTTDTNTDSETRT